jgi:hypothetical protein
MWIKRSVNEELLPQWILLQDKCVSPCEVDAMQHCLGGALAAEACGSACARSLGRWQEWWQGDGDAMDLNNNDAGIACAGSGDPISCCANSILDLSGNCK